MIKKMLVGYIQDGKHSGIDKYLLSFCEVACENSVKLDFLCDAVDPELNEKFKKMGFGLLAVSSLKQPHTQYLQIKKIIQDGSYDAVYLNISEAFNCTGLLAAAKCKVPVRIVHSHSSGVDRKNTVVRAVRTFLHSIFKGVVTKKTTHRYACSSVAGKWMFTGDFNIINNPVDADKFKFDSKKRMAFRKSLGIADDTLVFTHIGHFCYAKNSFFLVDIMREAVKINKKVHLLSVGIGDDLTEVKEYAKKLGIQNNISFLGLRRDIPDILCASDVFLLPSRFEGLPIVLLEAQFSALPCIASSAVSAEAKVSESFMFLPINKSKLWAQKAVDFASLSNRNVDFSNDIIQSVSLSNVKKKLIQILENN